MKTLNYSINSLPKPLIHKDNYNKIKISYEFLIYKDNFCYYIFRLSRA